MYCMCVHPRVSVFLACDTLADSIGPVDSRRLVFEWQSKGLADVHPVLLCLQILIVALVIVVLGLAVVRGRVAGQSWRRWHRGWSRVTETRGLRRRTVRHQSLKERVEVERLHFSDCNK